MPPILAVGGELKNTICLSRGRYAFLGQHIGDLENFAAFNFFEESIRHFEQTLAIRPTCIAHDLHPNYLATQWALRQPDIRTIAVQHHHAHIASCMAENHLEGEVIGIGIDGTGYGTDGAIWGGEILTATFQSFTRAFHLAYTPMPGSAQAIRQPWRMALAHLYQTFGEDWRSHTPASAFVTIPPKNLAVLEQLIRTRTNSPLTSSCGRLFDAVAALALNRTHVTYEAQAAIVLEAICDPRPDLGAYPFTLDENEADPTISTTPLFEALTHDLNHSTPASTISRRFHNGLADILTEATLHVAQRTHLDRVCLSGGVFLNVILSEALEARLTRAGLQVFTQSQVPPGDGGLSLGQLVVAAASSI
jgi:hydrogenase maturation protein HypF